ncbi:hypothetical protein [Photobacterium lipolyticum]|uniref:Uncharacterized protein n=1 Tax=Photobacterium lipolyticum TaxID=266810 RepID=A0A2T3N1L2_9GAMM|nr:hypothetical protein [Photobacterium lipolyticum]PSW06183.1 hypothetical protein C9I89_06655 [Photobacterium lipolyticum]
MSEDNLDWVLRDKQNIAQVLEMIAAEAPDIKHDTIRLFVDNNKQHFTITSFVLDVVCHPDNQALLTKETATHIALIHNFTVPIYDGNWSIRLAEDLISKLKQL